MKNLKTLLEPHCNINFAVIFFQQYLFPTQHLIALLFLLMVGSASAQSSKQDTVLSDTLKIDMANAHSPNKAALMSAIVPGLGQCYNKKYWKVPLVYAAIGTSLYFGVSNNRELKRYKTAYANRLDDDPKTIDEFSGRLNDAGLEANINYYQRNRDLAFIVAGLFYALNIVDAAVDAHLFSFPKNDNLSFNLQPHLELTQNNQVNKGFKLVINL